MQSWRQLERKSTRNFGSELTLKASLSSQPQDFGTTASFLHHIQDVSWVWVYKPPWVVVLIRKRTRNGVFLECRIRHALHNSFPESGICIPTLNARNQFPATSLLSWYEIGCCFCFCFASWFDSPRLISLHITISYTDCDVAVYVHFPSSYDHDLVGRPHPRRNRPSSTASCVRLPRTASPAWPSLGG